MSENDDALKPFTVFYSWQSDIKPEGHGRGLIRGSLRSAASAVEARLSGVRLVLDEATRGEVGSPDISSTIFRKIEAADVFVADVSIVNSSAGAGRKMPNPNVMIELGYAAGLLGWKRVVMVSNGEFGEVDALPFDIRQKSIFSFRCPPPTSDAQKDKSFISNATGMLSKHFAVAIEEIARANPDRPVVALVDRQQMLRQRDLKTLRELLLNLNAKIVDEITDDAPKRLHFGVLSFWDAFSTLWKSASTHLYDDRARALMERIWVGWSRIVSYEEHRIGVPGYGYVWETPGDFFPSKASEEDYGKAIREVGEFRATYLELVGYVRTHCVEIDLNELEKESRAQYERIKRRFAAMAESEPS